MTSSENMVERVARAICKVEGYDPDYLGDYGWNWEGYAAHARAAIEAMMSASQLAALSAAQTPTDPDIARIIGENRSKLYASFDESATRTSLTGDTK